MDKEIALRKSEHYCAYQERSKLEVLNKLHEWDVSSRDMDSIIEYLEKENYLNEERFAKAYSIGKFRMKNWGKIRIRQGLMMKGLSEKQIDLGLKDIPAEDYEKKLKQILAKKSEMLENLNPFQKNHTIAKYAIGQGYEPNLVWSLLERY